MLYYSENFNSEWFLKGSLDHRRAAANLMSCRVFGKFDHTYYLYIFVDILANLTKNPAKRPCQNKIQAYIPQGIDGRDVALDCRWR